MSITENKNRIGNFTSSKIFNLLAEGSEKGTFGKPALTYIKEKRWERKLKRSISTDADTRPTLWGTFLEPRVHELLPLTYIHVNDITLIHPKYNYWGGSPDFKQLIPDTEIVKIVSDLKCPQPKRFCELVDLLTLAIQKNDITIFSKAEPEYYWQLVSNACITGAKFIEMIIYMPYESELPEIRQVAENFEGLDQYKYRFISESPRSQLAYLPDGGFYKNLNIFTFAVPEIDCIRLEGKVISGGKQLLAA